MVQRFEGHFLQRVDQKGRTSVPAKYRSILEKIDVSELVVAAAKRWLDVHPNPSWEALVKMVEAQPRTPQREKYWFAYISPAQTVNWDKSGRILLPPNLRELVGIDKDQEVAIVGMEKHFRIMAKTAYDEYLSEARDGMDDNEQFVLVPKDKVDS